MKKQTAVDWLMDKLPTIDKYDPYYEDIIQQALAMEKEQIMDAVDGFPVENRHLDGEQYFTETYIERKSNEQ
jgi:hypothetical protein